MQIWNYRGGIDMEDFHESVAVQQGECWLALHLSQANQDNTKSWWVIWLWISFSDQCMYQWLICMYVQNKVCIRFVEFNQGY